MYCVRRKPGYIEGLCQRPLKPTWNLAHHWDCAIIWLPVLKSISWWPSALLCVVGGADLTDPVSSCLAGLNQTQWLKKRKCRVMLFISLLLYLKWHFCSSWTSSVASASSHSIWPLVILTFLANSRLTMGSSNSISCLSLLSSCRNFLLLSIFRVPPCPLFSLSTKNWHLPWALPSTSTRIKSCAAAAVDFQYPLKVQGGEQKWGSLCFGKTW